MIIQAAMALWALSCPAGSHQCTALEHTMFETPQACADVRDYYRQFGATAVCGNRNWHPGEEEQM